jgi:two-component system CheB/CheR fusion protein
MEFVNEVSSPRSVIQQIRMRSRNLLARRRQGSIADLYQAAAEQDDGEVTAEQIKDAGDQIKMFNGLLQTVCAKLLTKIKELDRTHGDLHSLMEVSAIPAIFVDENLHVRRFSQRSEEIYSLSVQDIGQSLLDAACYLTYWELEDDFRQAAETGEPVKRYLERRGGGAHYWMRILPNFHRDNAFAGAALFFVKVSSWPGGQA